MIYLKTPEEIEQMRAAATLVSQTLAEVGRWIEPGVTTRKLDTIAREFILDNGGKPACLGYEGFPGTLCIEVNETVVHGFPGERVLLDGDIVGIDTVVEIGPGKALSGLFKKTAPAIKTYHIDTAADFHSVVSALKGETA